VRGLLGREGTCKHAQFMQNTAHSRNFVVRNETPRTKAPSAAATLTMACPVAAPLRVAVRGRANPGLRRVPRTHAVRGCRAVTNASAVDSASPFAPGWRTPAMAVFWDLDNLRPPAGYETLWAYRLVEAAFEFADVVHIRAYAREGSVDGETEQALREIGVTFTKCPTISEGADVILSTDVMNLVRDGGHLAADAENAKGNVAAAAVKDASSFAVMVATRDEGMAECLAFVSARRDLCDGALVAGEFLAKNMHRPQFARAMSGTAGDDAGVTAGYWRIMTHVAGKTNKGILGKSKLTKNADATILWDSKRLFDMPDAGEAGEEGTEEEETEEPTDASGDDDWEVDDLSAIDAAPGGFAAMFRDGELTPWPPGTPIPEE
jgi:hypothetical protein